MGEWFLTVQVKILNLRRKPWSLCLQNIVHTPLVTWSNIFHFMGLIIKCILRHFGPAGLSFLLKLLDLKLMLRNLLFLNLFQIIWRKPLCLVKSVLLIEHSWCYRRLPIAHPRRNFWNYWLLSWAPSPRIRFPVYFEIVLFLCLYELKWFYHRRLLLSLLGAATPTPAFESLGCTQLMAWALRAFPQLLILHFTHSQIVKYIVKLLEILILDSRRVFLLFLLIFNFFKFIIPAVKHLLHLALAQWFVTFSKLEWFDLRAVMKINWLS